MSSPVNAGGEPDRIAGGSMAGDRYASELLVTLISLMKRVPNLRRDGNINPVRSPASWVQPESAHFFIDGDQNGNVIAGNGTAEQSVSAVTAQNSSKALGARRLRHSVKRIAASRKLPANPPLLRPGNVRRIVITVRLEQQTAIHDAEARVRHHGVHGHRQLMSGLALVLAASQGFSTPEPRRPGRCRSRAGVLCRTTTKSRCRTPRCWMKNACGWR